MSALSNLKQLADLVVYHYYDEDDVPDAFGLQNTGAICWFNSLLQMLLGLPSLNKLVIEYADELQENPFAAEYVKLVKECLGLSSANINRAASSSIILQHMLARLRAEKSHVRMGMGQECVDEGLTMFIEMLNCPKIKRLFSNVYELSIECTYCNKVVSTMRDGAIRIQMFTQMPLATQDEFCTFIRAHPSVVDVFKCTCGGVMTKFHRFEKLKMLREIVVIIFNKFDEKTVRWFPQTMSFKSSQGGTLEYKLVGKIDHSGNRQGGHYWANSLRGNQWYNLNDTSVGAGTGTPEASTFMVAYHLVMQ